MSTPRIGLALGAGGARGIAHIHVLRALDSLGLKPSMITGSSIGSIVGACYAGGMSGDDLSAFLLKRFGDARAIFSSAWELRSRSFDELTRDRNARFGELDLARILERLLPEELPGQIEDLAIETCIVATRYYQYDDAVFDKGPLVQALSASAALPAVFPPVIQDGVVLVDGGATNPLPIDLLQGKTDFIIGVDVAGGPVPGEVLLPGKYDALLATSQLMQKTITREKVKNMRCNVLLTPPVGKWRVRDFMRADEVLNATSFIFEDAKRAIGKALDEAHIAE